MIYAFGMARLGRDAELRYTPNGDAVCNLSLAFSYGKKDESGQRPTTWVDASLWGRRAEALVPYLLKGTALTVAIEELHIDTYRNREGLDVPKLSARITDIDLGVSPAVERAPERAAPEPQRRAAPMPAGARVAPAPRGPARAPANSGSGFDDMDDDVPF